MFQAAITDSKDTAERSSTKNANKSARPAVGLGIGTERAGPQVKAVACPSGSIRHSIAAASRGPLVPSVSPALRGVGASIQTKLVVNQRGDKYEQEADRVAEQVMRMSSEASGEPPNDTPPSADGASPGIQRKCKLCEEEGTQTVHRSAKQGDGSPPSPRISDGSLRSGGEPLPSGLRRFYEPRFGRDFSGVRVHTGPVSASYSESLHAHAFTYGNHVWLGSGQSLAPSLLMAHELAHVVQQSRPAVLARKAAEPTRSALYDTQPVIRRFEPYWEPEDMNGTRNHALVLPDIGAANKTNNLFTEAPVSNAKTSEGDNSGALAGFGRTGYADLYRATPATTVGVFFLGNGRPAATPNKNGVKMGGAPFDHNALSRPQVSGGVLSGSADAPRNIEIGDLKPNSGLQILNGIYQLRGYKQGFEQAHEEAQDPATKGDGKSWNPLSVSMLGRKSVTIPPQFAFGSFAGQTARDLVIKQTFGKSVRPSPSVTGHLCVQPHITADGIWVYAWVPTTSPTPAQLPPRIRRLAPVLQQKIINPLLQSPVQAAPSYKPVEAIPVTDVEAAPVSPEPSIVQRKEITAPEKDNFDYEAWKASLKDVTTEYDSSRTDPEFKDTERNLLANRAQEHLRQGMGVAVPELGEGKETAHTLSKVEFWTGKSAAVVGFFRHLFGGAFVKVAQFFVKVRDKVRGFLKKMKAKVSVGGGFLGAALKAAFKGIKLIAGFVVGKITERLMHALILGVSKKLTALIGSDVVEEVEAKIAEVHAIADAIEKKATDTVDALLERTLGVHIKDLEKLKDVYDIFLGIVSVVNLVRWGARVIACLSPPALGCLWILGEAALDFAAQKVAETCWFQEKLRPILQDIKYLTTELPNKLADGLISRVKDLLPTSVADVLHVSKDAIVPGENDVQCDEEDDHTAYVESPLHKQIDEMYVKIGPERAAALQTIARKMKAPKDQALTAEQISSLSDSLLKVDPAKLTAYANAYPAGAIDGAPDLSATLKTIENPPASAPSSGPNSTPAPIPESEKEPLSQAGGTEAKGSDKPSDGKDASGGVETIDAADHRSNAKKSSDLPGVRVQVANPDAATDVAGAHPMIHVLISVNGAARLLVRNIKTTVASRAYYPDGSNAENAVALIIRYRVMEGVRVESLGGLIPAGSIFEGAVYTAKGTALSKTK